MRFFVTGVGGQLGHDVMNELLKRGHKGVGSDIQENYSGVADGSAVTKAPYVALDITDKDAVEKVITEVNPDAVIHCAAWTAVDMAEDDDKVAKVRAINAGGTQNIADRVCSVVAIGFIFNVVCYRINPIKEAFAVGTLLSAFVWLYLSNRDFKSIKLDKREIALIVCTEVAFLTIGMNLSAIVGFILYIVVEIVLYMLLMRQTVVEIIGLLSRTLKKVMRKKSC